MQHTLVRGVISSPNLVKVLNLGKVYGMEN